MDHGNMDHMNMGHATVTQQAISGNMNMNHGGMNMNHGGMNMPPGGMDMNQGGMNMNQGGMNMSHANMNMNDMSMSMSMPMSMYFHGGYQEYLLFEAFQTKSVTGFVVACVGVFLLGITLELLRMYREEHFVMYCGRRNLQASDKTCCEFKPPPDSRWKWMLGGSHLVQTALHLVQFWLSYCLMLVFMTYNVWLCVSLALGAATGYWLVGWRRHHFQVVGLATGECCP